MFESGSAVGLAACSRTRLAELFAANQAELVERECRVLVLAAAWADAHDIDVESGSYQPLVERACQWGGAGTPQVSEFCAAELGALQGSSAFTARLLIADVLDLRHRLPKLWAQVLAGQVRAWQGRKVAQQTRMLSWDAAAEVDEAVAGLVGALPWPRFQKVLAAAIIDADPDVAVERAQRTRTDRDVWAVPSEDGLKLLLARVEQGDGAWFLATVNRIADILAADGDTDPVGVRRSRAVGILARPAEALRLLLAHQDDPEEPAAGVPEDEREDSHQSLDLTPPVGFSSGDLKAARPRVVLSFHLNSATVRDGHGLVRPEGGEALTLDEFTAWLTRSGCQVSVRPVVDPAHLAPVDGYETPTRLRAALRLRHPAEVFPFGTGTSAHLDLDHTIPYLPPSRGGPPGQTSLANLGPLSRSSHRAVTHGGWRRRQPEPGRYVFRSPTGYVYLVTSQGTLPLGRNRFADQLWLAAAPAPNHATVAGAARPATTPATSKATASTAQPDGSRPSAQGKQGHGHRHTGGSAEPEDEAGRGQDEAWAAGWTLVAPRPVLDESSSGL